MTDETTKRGVFCTREEAATELGLRLSMIDRLIKAKVLRAKKMAAHRNGRVLVFRASVEEFAKADEEVEQ